MSLLARSSRRYILGHPWQFGLSVIGVALGVAVVISVDLANGSAQRAFEISSGTVTGRATHQIVAGPGGVPEELFRRLRSEAGLRRVAPVVEGYLRYVPAGSEEDAGQARILRLLGIDPFSEAPFRADLRTGPANLDLRAFLTRPGAVLLSPETASALGVEQGAEFEVAVGPRRRALYAAGAISAPDDNTREAVADLLVADIATAQATLGMVGTLSRLDLILEGDAAGERLERAVRSLLPPGTRLVTSAQRNDTTRQMTRAFRVNLTALSLLALVCGVFLVYNTMSFSVVQRRSLIGIMRAMGVTRREVFRLVLTEAVCVGAFGTVLGIAGGIAIGSYLVALVTRTINDLYFVVAVRELALTPLSLLKGALLGVVGSALAALPAALEATGTRPRETLVRSTLEARSRRRAAPAALAGTLLLAGGALLLSLSGSSLVLSFAALFLAILGFALWTPQSVVAAMALSTAPLVWLMGPLGRLATRGVVAALSRTAVAVAALMIAISVAIGVGVMIDSFRGTVTQWLGTVLVADLYVAPPPAGASAPPLAWSSETAARVSSLPGIDRISTIRGVEIPTSDGGRTRLIALDIDIRGQDGFPFSSGEPETAWADFRDGDAVFVTEPFAYRSGLSVGDDVELLTTRGPKRFRIAAVYYNYASEEGLVAMSRATYDRHWDDTTISGFSVFLTPDADLSASADRIRGALRGDEVVIQSNRALRAASLEVFDRTFLITGVLRLLVTLVALIGVLSALMALQLERAREVGVLRAMGMTPREVWRLNTSQSGLMGLVSGLLAIPVGLGLAAIMIFVINRRSFGWSLEMDVAPGILIQAIFVATMASLAAGVYPAFRMARTRPSTALREE